MSRRPILACCLLLFCAVFLAARAQTSLAAPSGPLTCHKEVCPQPQSACQVLETQGCVHGGGHPRCPAIINAPNGASCSDGNSCTTGDVCTAGVCGGTPVVCSSPTDTCSLSSGCATRCDSTGCTVAAAGGVSNPMLTVPPGALNSAVNISMVDLGGDAGDASVFHVYSFSPTGTIFAIPATVDLPSPPLAAGQIALIEVSDDGTNWSAIATTPNGARVTGPIAHFSRCRTRAVVQGPGGGDLIVLDMVQYQDLAQTHDQDGVTPPPPATPDPILNRPGLVIPPLGEDGSCYPGDAFSRDLFGVCFKMKNPTTQIFKSSCPTPLPTPPNPLPAGCHLVHVIPWQCYNGSRDFPLPFDPANPTAFEGQHCDNTGLLIPCAETIYTMDQFLPVGGLAPGAEIWVDLSFLGGTNPPPPTPANGVFPYSCFGSSFIGIDLIFREPTPTDTQGGIRSAKDGPFIEVQPGVVVTWEQLVAPQSANYPSLRFTQPTTNFPARAIKHWLIDARF